MKRKEFLKNFEEHLKIPFSLWSRKRHYREEFRILKGKASIELVRDKIIQSIVAGLCPFGGFTSYIQRRSPLWQKQVFYYAKYKYSYIIHKQMSKIVTNYKPVGRKKK